MAQSPKAYIIIILILIVLLLLMMMIIIIIIILIIIIIHTYIHTRYDVDGSTSKDTSRSVDSSGADMVTSILGVIGVEAALIGSFSGVFPNKPRHLLQIALEIDTRKITMQNIKKIL